MLLSTLWLALGVMLIGQGDLSGTLLLNSWHNAFLDRPMFWLSEASGGYIITSLAVIPLARPQPVQALTATIAAFVAWYASITVKYNHFAHWKSPSELLSDQLHYLPNRLLEPELGFPSSQAAVITCLAVYLSWINRDRWPPALYVFMGSLLLLFSRLYAGWSFAADVLAGSVLGAVMGLICILWLPPRLENWYEKRSQWWQDMITAILRAAAVCTIFINLKYFHV